MHIMQLRVERDPLTGRDISKACWNGHHQQSTRDFEREDEDCCHEEMCKCFCHERTAQGDD